jgi:hypothetical protein
MNNGNQLGIVLNGKVYLNKKYGGKFVLQEKGARIEGTAHTLGVIDYDGDIDIISYCMYESFKFPAEFHVYINNGKGELAQLMSFAYVHNWPNMGDTATITTLVEVAEIGPFNLKMAYKTYYPNGKPESHGTYKKG